MPISKLPLESIRIRSVEFVPKVSGNAPIVTTFTVEPLVYICRLFVPLESSDNKPPVVPLSSNVLYPPKLATTVEVPIPTLPLESIRIRSLVPTVLNNILP